MGTVQARRRHVLCAPKARSLLAARRCCSGVGASCSHSRVSAHKAPCGETPACGRSVGGPERAMGGGMGALGAYKTAPFLTSLAAPLMHTHMAEQSSRRDPVESPPNACGKIGTEGVKTRKIE